MSLKPFCKLADASRYIACRWDLRADEPGRRHWVTFHRKNFETLLALGVKASVARGANQSESDTRAADARKEFNHRLDEFWAKPQSYELVTILTLDEWRDGALRAHRFPDPMIDLKNRENEKMLPLLPQVCAELDSLKGQEQIYAVVTGVFAGNIFDMGSEATAGRFLAGGPDFFAVRKSLAPRPWLVDDFDALCARLLNGPKHRKGVYFIDNAGSDFLLGALPMIRWLAKRDTEMVLAANDFATLNDMTIGDVRDWWSRILHAEPSLKDLPITLAGTGTGEPLIDLSEVSDELNDACSDVDFVILEGMGRGVETNLDADFSCDALNLSMLKDTAVAARHKGKLYDTICRFRGPA